jgi:C_GCAxxG_C_C family probable redox protein
LQGLQAYYGLENENLWQLATGLGAGVSRRGFICGAITGGTLACGMVTAMQRGSTREDVRGLREETYSRVQELTRRFEARFGTVECRKMTGCDFLTPEGQAHFKESQGMDRTCRPAVRLVVESVIEICG